MAVDSRLLFWQKKDKKKEENTEIIIYGNTAYAVTFENKVR